jgi:hypothetical protein
MKFDMSSPIVNIWGTEYLAELGLIEHTALGYEDHGIFTYMLDMDFAGHNQGFGGRFIANLRDVLESILKVTGSNGWESVRGKRLYALRTTPYGLIEGLLSLDQERVFLPGVQEELIVDPRD